jgi:hypothetical protein
MGSAGFLLQDPTPTWIFLGQSSLITGMGKTYSGIDFALICEIINKGAT